MPCDDKTLGSFEGYVETLHELQGYVDNCVSPFIIMGDFNAKLPQATQLSANWYRGRFFSKRSALLYNFVCDNDSYVANFDFDQTVNFTYRKGEVKSYIDHIILSQCLRENVSLCSIIEECADNVSDHLPIMCSLRIPLPHVPSLQNATPANAQKFTRVNWKDPSCRELYLQHLTIALQRLHVQDISSVNSLEEATTAVNRLSAALNEAMHSAAAAAAGATTQHDDNPRRKRHWWTQDCRAARDRSRLFFHMWKSLGRPQEGVVLECYKHSRKVYRRVCRAAMNCRTRRQHLVLEQLYHSRRPGQFWNSIRKMRISSTNYDAINIETLRQHFSEKFSAHPSNTDVHDEPSFVHQKMQSLSAHPMNSVMISERRIIRLIKTLRTGCSAGADGICAEHLKYAIGSTLPLHLSILLTLSLRHGCLPQVFYTGLVTPVLKKTHLDPSKPQNYRPITVSVCMSKLLELYVLEECSAFEAHPCQFGFVAHRGTSTAVTLAADVCSYCVSRGSTVYLCSLDAEGAFDCLPHDTLFEKASEVLPDHCWRIMCLWYSHMKAAIKWGGLISEPIPVTRGTRQGGLSSPLLFNIFYKELITRLDAKDCGINIKGVHYNVFCYADDVLLASTTPTGLQSLIDEAVSCISANGLRFNPAKTLCMTYGRSTLSPPPSWTIDGCTLGQTEALTYLGAQIVNDRGRAHVQRRCQAAQKAFFGLQGAGLHFRGIEPEIAAHIYAVGVRTILTYACESTEISNSTINQLQVHQGKLLKAMLGLSKYSRTSPLEKALRIPTIRSSIALSCFNLFKSCLMYPSKATNFYCNAMQNYFTGMNLLTRSFNFAHEFGVNLFKFVFNPHYAHSLRPCFYSSVEDDGLVDSIRFILSDYGAFGARDLLQQLVHAF